MIRTQTLESAFLGSAAAGAGVIGIAFVLSFVAPPMLAGGIPPAELTYALGNLGLFTVYVLVCAFVVFCIGLGVFGLPAWFVLHRIGGRSRTDAAVAGGVLSALPPAALIIATGGLDDPSAIVGGLVVAGAGAVAGLTFRRIAYGPAIGP